MHEIWKLLQKIEEEKKERRADNFERNLLIKEFSFIVDQIEYQEYRKPIIKQAFKAIINRSFSTHNEIHALIGAFKSMNTAMKTPSGKWIVRERRAFAHTSVFWERLLQADGWPLNQQ